MQPASPDDERYPATRAEGGILSQACLGGGSPTQAFEKIVLDQHGDVVAQSHGIESRDLIDHDLEDRLLVDSREALDHPPHDVQQRLVLAFRVRATHPPIMHHTIYRVDPLGGSASSMQEVTVRDPFSLPLYPVPSRR